MIKSLLRGKMFAIEFFDLLEYLPEIKKHPFRSLGEGERNEAWLPVDGPCGELREKLSIMANDYAHSVLGTEAIMGTALVHNSYNPGDWCVEHIDQYFYREVPDTGSRTVSMSLQVERAAEGGLFHLQDRDRERPRMELDLMPGQVIFFPADWHHGVTRIERGIKRSIVCWWRHQSEDRFRS